MPGVGHRTHDFPRGTPLLLKLMDTAFAGLLLMVFGICVLVFGLNGWRTFAPAFAICIGYAITRSLLLTRFERSGDAIPINRVSMVVRFPDGFPKPLLAARLAFFIVAGLMLVFGVAPFPFDVVKNGIIACVFGLIVVAIANLLIESHYVRARLEAINLEFIRKPKEPGDS